jgi:hypothetical protein
MEYKFVRPLVSPLVLPFDEWLGTNIEDLKKKRPLAQHIDTVNKAAECGWFKDNQPNVKEMEPAEIIELGKRIFKEFNRVMGLDNPNSQSESQTTQKK